MIKYTPALLLLFFSYNTLAQKIISGKVETKDKNPIAYVNIGIRNSPVGTLSNEDGTFSVSVPAKFSNDTLTYSALGFGTRLMPLSLIKQKTDTIVVLTEKITTLRTVSVFGKKEKKETYWLGNRFTKGGFLYADSVSAGSAMALLIENKYPTHHTDLTYPVFVEGANLFIDKNSVDNFKIRIRIAERDSLTNAPGNDLLTESIIITSSIKKGWLKIDLSSYRMQIDGPFFLVAEWIMTDNDRLSLLNQYASYRKANPDKVVADSTVVNGKKIGFWSYLNFSPGTHFGISAIPFSLQNYTCYYRTNSLGEWTRSPVILSARVALTTQLSNAKKSEDEESLK